VRIRVMHQKAAKEVSVSAPINRCARQVQTVKAKVDSERFPKIHCDICKDTGAMMLCRRRSRRSRRSRRIYSYSMIL
jgi:hypothetical protein